MDLIEAAKMGNLVEVNRLLKEGAGVNAADMYGETALMLAAEKGHAEVVCVLLNQGADVNAKSYRGTALMWAAYNGHVEVVHALLGAGADVNAKDYKGWTAQMFAFYRSDVELCHLLEAEEVWQRRKALLAARYSE